MLPAVDARALTASPRRLPAVPLLAILGLVVVLVLGLGAAAPAGAATISNWPATTFSGGFGEPSPAASSRNPYSGQTFTAPDGSLDSLRFVLESESLATGNVADNEFRLLITDTSGDPGGQSFRPLDTCHGAPGVCFESGDLLMPLGSGDGTVQQEFLVPLGGLQLQAGATYAFLLDAFVTADGLGSHSGIGRRPGGHDGFPRSRQISGEPQGATRADHFDNPWNVTVTGDVAFILTYTPVPEPGSGALLALGLLGLVRRQPSRPGKLGEAARRSKQAGKRA